MLDKQSKCVLKTLITLADKYNNVYDLNKVYSKLPKYTENQINDSINYMCKEGYLTSSYDLTGDVEIFIEYKGLHYKNFNRVEFNKFMMKSFLTPIIVSTITTLITLWIKDFFLK